jgi:hypothetical protein
MCFLAFVIFVLFLAVGQYTIRTAAKRRRDTDPSRLQLVQSLQRGDLPKLSGPISLPLQRNEIAHFRFAPVEFWQERTVSREYVGGSSGVSMHIARGMTYHIGSHRGHVVSRSKLVRIARGDLILTSKRLIFSGEKAFSIPLAKILHFSPFRDAFRITKDSTAENAKPFYFFCADPELAMLALSACLNV